MPRLTYDDKKAEDTFNLNRPSVSLETLGNDGNPRAKASIGVDLGDSGYSAGVTGSYKTDRGQPDSYSGMFSLTRKF